MRGLLLALHLLGTALWLGGLFALGIWTARARRTGQAEVVAFAYSAAARMYRGVISISAFVTVIAGAALVFMGPWKWFQPFPDHWLFQMQVLGLLALAATVLFLVPNSTALARLVEGDLDPGAFRRRVKLQAIVGSVVGGVLIYTVILGGVRF